MNQAKKMNRITYIDGLKGLACLIVLLFHFNAAFVVDDVCVRNLQKPFSLLTDGSWAVSLFLLLSGFTISQVLYAKQNYQDIILKRYFRLSFPIALIQIMAFVLGMAGCFTNKNVSLITHDPWFGTFYDVFSVQSLLKGIFFTIPYGAEFAIPYIAPAWMICYIFWGTFLVIILCFGSRGLKKQKKVLFYLIAMILLFPQRYLLSVGIGAMVSTFYSDVLAIKKKALFSTTMLFLSCLCYSFIGLHSVSTLFFFLFILTSLNAQKVLNTVPLQLLGKVSLWVYLIHWPVICSVGGAIFVFYMEDTMMAFYISLFVSSVFTLFLSYGAVKYLDPLFKSLVDITINYIKK